MKFLSMALLIAASFVTSSGYSQVSIRIGRVAPPPPVVVYESGYPAPCPVYRERGEVVMAEPRRGYGYDRRYQERRYQNDRFEDRRRNDRRYDDRDYDTRGRYGY